MKKLTLALILGLLFFSSLHAQQTVVIERPGILTDLATAAGAIVSLPLAAVEGIIVGTLEATCSMIHGSTQIIMTPPPRAVPAPTVIVAVPPVVLSPADAGPCAPAVVPSTTIITKHSDGTITTVTRQASAYELGPVVLEPVEPTHRVGSSPLVNPYIYRPH